jgi:hypothetical protein
LCFRYFASSRSNLLGWYCRLILVTCIPADLILLYGQWVYYREQISFSKHLMGGIVTTWVSTSMTTNRPLPDVALNKYRRAECRACQEHEKRSLVWLSKIGSHGHSNDNQPPPLPIHTTFAALEASAKAGCQKCRLWRKMLLNECYSTEEVQSLNKSLGAITLSFPDHTSYPESAKFQLIVETRDSKGLRRVATAYLDDCYSFPKGVPGTFIWIEPDFIC